VERHAAGPGRPGRLLRQPRLVRRLVASARPRGGRGAAGPGRARRRPPGGPAAPGRPLGQALGVDGHRPRSPHPLPPGAGRRAPRRGGRRPAGRGGGQGRHAVAVARRAPRPRRRRPGHGGGPAAGRVLGAPAPAPERVPGRGRGRLGRASPPLRRLRPVGPHQGQPAQVAVGRHPARVRPLRRRAGGRRLRDLRRALQPELAPAAHARDPVVPAAAADRHRGARLAPPVRARGGRGPGRRAPLVPPGAGRDLALDRLRPAPGRDQRRQHHHVVGARADLRRPGPPAGRPDARPQPPQGPAQPRPRPDPDAGGDQPDPGLGVTFPVAHQARRVGRGLGYRLRAHRRRPVAPARPGPRRPRPATPVEVRPGTQGPKVEPLELDPGLRRFLAVAGGHPSPEAMAERWAEQDSWWRVGERPRATTPRMPRTRAGSPGCTGRWCPGRSGPGGAPRRCGRRRPGRPRPAPARRTPASGRPRGRW
jgi:hypothetical protein